MVDAVLERIANGRTDLVIPWVRGGGSPAAEAQGVQLAGWCAYYGDASALEFLRGQGVSLEVLGDDLGLNGAAFHGHWRLCQYLIEHGADPNRALADTSETPLHSALCKRESAAHERVVEVLLVAGASATPATIAGVETGCFMRDVRTRGETPLHRAAAYGTLRAILLLLEAGADPGARDVNGDSPLGWASWALRDAEVLHHLCFGDHRVSPRRKTMAENLLGMPRPG